MPKGKSQRRPRRVAKRAKRAKPTGAFKKKVLAVIRTQAETKQVFHSIVAENFNSSPNSTADAKRLLPNINYGTGDYQKIGDQVKAMSLTLKGAIVYNPSVGQYGTYANARLGVRLMIVQPRQFTLIDDVQANASTWTALLLKKGGTNVSFTGSLSDLWAPINSDAIIKYYDKIFYMDAPYQVTAIGSQYMGGSTRMFSKSLKIRNKTLKYDASISGGINPTNYAPVLLIGYVHMDGSAPDVTSTAIQVSYDTVFSYEDA